MAQRIGRRPTACTSDLLYCLRSQDTISPSLWLYRSCSDHPAWRSDQDDYDMKRRRAAGLGVEVNGFVDVQWRPVCVLVS
ncbi:MAG: hypothetical protein HUU55_05395 [Myxococcales bacterium]|nr:hypothetical protein [Myxococcales bacterium]